MKQTFPVKATLLLSEDGLSIEIIDAVSGVCFIDVEVGCKETMAAFGRLAHVAATATIYHKTAAPIGYKVETKIETIDFEPVKRRTGARFDRMKHGEMVVAPYVRDGWDCTHGSSADWLNHHRCVADERYNVHFRRWVSPTGEPWTR